ncbi:MAG: TlpA disulfide reductase family protein [Trueperaceae bacterium]
MSGRSERRSNEKDESAPTGASTTRSRMFRFGAGAVAFALLLGGALLWSTGSAGGHAMPDFEMVAYQGAEVLGGETSNFHAVLDGGKPVVLNFWASECPPCREEMPSFQRVHDEFGGAFTMVGIDVGPYIGLGTRAGARGFLTEFGIDYPTAYAASGNVIRDYEVMGMPTTFFFGADGSLIKRHTGFMPEANFRREVESLLTTVE